MMGVKARRILLLAILIGIALLTVAGLALGSASVPGLWQVITHPWGAGPGHEIVWGIRFPRILGALLVGMALGVAGALAQSATNSPLADPAIIGTAAGASVGAALGIVLNLALVGTVPIAIAATIGALLASVVTFSLAKGSIQLIIVGIATSSLLTAISGLIVSIGNRPDARSISFWSLGSFALTNMETVKVLAPVVLIASVAGWLYSQSMDLLVLGDREVRHLGKNPDRLRFIAFIFISILIGVSVSSVGSIAFIALAAPHITRYLIGPTNRPLVIGSAVIGAGLLLLSDIAARTIATPNELPIGLITSLIGAPILIIVLKRSRGVWQ
jgi:iron complex transport system permease protein